MLTVAFLFTLLLGGLNFPISSCLYLSPRFRGPVVVLDSPLMQGLQIQLWYQWEPVNLLSFVCVVILQANMKRLWKYFLLLIQANFFKFQTKMTPAYGSSDKLYLRLIFLFIKKLVHVKRFCQDSSNDFLAIVLIFHLLYRIVIITMEILAEKLNGDLCIVFAVVMSNIMNRLVWFITNRSLRKHS